MPPVLKLNWHVSKIILLICLVLGYICEEKHFVAVLDVQAFERLLGPCMDIMKRNFNHYEDQLVKIFGSKSNVADLRWLKNLWKKWQQINWKYQKAVQRDGFCTNRYKFFPLVLDFQLITGVLQWKQSFYISYCFTVFLAKLLVIVFILMLFQLMNKIRKNLSKVHWKKDSYLENTWTTMIVDFDLFARVNKRWKLIHFKSIA